MADVVLQKPTGTFAEYIEKGSREASRDDELPRELTETKNLAVYWGNFAGWLGTDADGWAVLVEDQSSASPLRPQRPDNNGWFYIGNDDLSLWLTLGTAKDLLPTVGFYGPRSSNPWNLDDDGHLVVDRSLYAGLAMGYYPYEGVTYFGGGKELPLVTVKFVAVS